MRLRDLLSIHRQHLDEHLLRGRPCAGGGAAACGGMGGAPRKQGQGVRVTHAQWMAAGAVGAPGAWVASWKEGGLDWDLQGQELAAEDRRARVPGQERSSSGVSCTKGLVAKRVWNVPVRARAGGWGVRSISFWILCSVLLIYAILSTNSTQLSSLKLHDKSFVKDFLKIGT